MSITEHSIRVGVKWAQVSFVAMVFACITADIMGAISSDRTGWLFGLAIPAVIVFAMLPISKAGMAARLAAVMGALSMCLVLAATWLNKPDPTIWPLVAAIAIGVMITAFLLSAVIHHRKQAHQNGER